MDMKYCKQCRRIKKITHNKHAKCFKCGMNKLTEKVDLTPVNSRNFYIKHYNETFVLCHD